MHKLFLRAAGLTLIIMVQVTPRYSVAAEVPLPLFSVTDVQGNAISSDALKQTRHWVMVVVASNNQTSREFLNNLQMNANGWGDGLAIVVIGNLAEFTSLMANNGKLIGVRWYRDESGTLTKTLNLPGIPAALGMNSDNKINWHSIGLPQQLDKAQSLVGSWINIPSKVPVVK